MKINELRKQKIAEQTNNNHIVTPRGISIMFRPKKTKQNPKQNQTNESSAS